MSDPSSPNYGRRTHMDQLVGRVGPGRSEISVRRAQAQVDQRIRNGDFNPDGTWK